MRAIQRHKLPLLLAALWIAVSCGPAARTGTASARLQAQDDVSFITHKVKWYETMEEVAQRYGLSAEEIMYYNGMKRPDLSKGQQLRIPRHHVRVPSGWFSDTGQEAGRPEPPSVRQTPEDRPVIVQEKPQTGRSDPFSFPRDIVRLTLLLPFNTAAAPSETNMDFYAGVLLAVKDLEESGTGTRLSVYDVAGGAMPEREVFEQSDAVLGPVSVQDLMTALGVCSDNAVIMSPLDQKALSLSADNHNFIQAPTPPEHQYAEMARWAAEECGYDDRLILICEKNADNAAPAETALHTLERLHIPCTRFAYSPSREGNTINAALTDTLDMKAMNRVILASESETFAEDVIRNIAMLMNKGYSITTYAPSRVRTFDSIDLNVLHSTEIHITAPYFVDYTDEAVKRFVIEYRSLYRTEPSQFAFQGYDTARLLISLVAKYGSGWMNHLAHGRTGLLHTDFDFLRQENGSYVNTAVRRIIYGSDNETRLVRP